MENEGTLLQCYNRGCGQKYDPAKNSDDSCRHHPGEPFFHDAYKGWSCCNKKCTDFTEFLNIKGCTLSKHSNVKPPEPEKVVVNNVPDEVVEVKPIVPIAMERPPFETPMVTIKPEIAPSLKQQLESSTNNDQKVVVESNDSGEIAVGTICKNGGCNESYQGPDSNNGICVHHPGVPIFHEGLKYWSCCQKRTSDFNAFLNQVGCERGKHVWKKEETDNKSVQCRWDYHQTGTHVIVSIYAKQYCPVQSIVQLNPIRLYTKLVFPQQSNAAFELDIELRGIVNVDKSQVFMYGTKVEIKLKKAEPGAWTKLEIRRISDNAQSKTKQEDTSKKVENLESQVDAVDLSDL